jgi:RNA polymerase-binding transcription factor
MVASNTAVNKPAAKKTTQKATASKAKEKRAPAAEEGSEPATRRPAKRAAKKTAAKNPTNATAATTTAAKKAAAKKPPAKKAAKKAVRTPTNATAAEESTARKTGAKKVAAKKSTADTSPTAAPPARTAAPAAPGDLAVRSGEDPWTEAEVAEARAGLRDEADRLRGEISASEEALTGLMRDSGDGAGDDQADTGTKNVTREHEMALATNAREVLRQTERALGRLEAGTYGLCENCGNPIGKARMQAFPRATLCVDCKQKQERRF